MTRARRTSKAHHLTRTFRLQPDPLRPRDCRPAFSRAALLPAAAHQHRPARSAPVVVRQKASIPVRKARRPLGGRAPPASAAVWRFQMILGIASARSKTGSSSKSSAQPVDGLIGSRTWLLSSRDFTPGHCVSEARPNACSWRTHGDRNGHSEAVERAGLFDVGRATRGRASAKAI
jgi:hypothetical protein